VSERSDFEKFLDGLGAKRAAPGKRHLCWQIGSRPFSIPGNLSGRRAYLNYEAAARKIAAEEGLISTKLTGAASSDRSREQPQRPQASSPDYPRVSHGTRQDLDEWNRLENERWRSPLHEGRLEMDLPERRIRETERLPIVEQILRAVNEPLTAMEIARIGVSDWDWKNADVAGHAVLRLFKAHPKRFRAIRGTKRNERWELVPPEPPATPQIPTPEAPEVSHTAPSAREATVADVPSATSNAENKLKLVHSILEEFQLNRDSWKEPYQAFYALGRIHEILGEVSTPSFRTNET